jgi:hypothetical protein
MAEWLARCAICHTFIFVPDKCVAFRRTSQGGIVAAEIRHVGKSGTGCVCRDCVRVLAGQLVKVATPATTEERDGVHG